MRILSWNCNGALWKKYHLLFDFNADVIVIQECENPLHSKNKQFREWSGNHLWIGPEKGRGLGIFSKNGTELSDQSFIEEEMKFFLPCRINGHPFIGVWAKHGPSLEDGYIGQIWNFSNKYMDYISNDKIIMAGDWNSNTQWDYKRTNNHSHVVKFLSGLGIRSLYHEKHCLQHGKEIHPTFFMHRKQQKPYHIDYIFCGKGWSADHIEMGKYENWYTHSDHIPILSDISER